MQRHTTVGLRAATPIVSAAWTAAVALTAAVVVVAFFRSGSPTLADGLRLASGAVWTASGALLVLRAVPSPMGAVTGAMLLANGMSPSAQFLGSPVLGRLILATALGLAVVTVAVFPTFTFVPRWLRWLVVAFVGWQLATVAWVPTNGSAYDVAGGVVFFLGLGLPVGAQVYRYRHQTDPTQRARTKWVVYGVCLALTADLVVSLPYFAPDRFARLVAAGSSYDTMQEVVTTLALLAIPVCLVIAMLVGNLFDVDVVISRTLVYGGLTLGIVVGYAAVLAVLGAAIGHGSNGLASLAAAAVVAVLFGPLRAWLQRRVRRLVYGLRSEPYDALRLLGQRLAGSVPDDDVPAQLVATVRRSLRAPYVAVTIGETTAAPVRAESGAPTGQTFRVPVVHLGEEVGVLQVGYDERRPLSPSDKSLLADLASQAGSAVHNVQLTASLRRGTEALQLAREQLIVAREEERRRLRRDLHDGLAPTLAAAGLMVETAADLADRDGPAAARLLARLQQTLRGAAGDIRTLVDELRPAALDELGLVRAIEDRAAELRPHIEVSVQGPAHPHELPAAVEVAAYRICQEALMNVVKHARASCVRVEIAVAADVQLTVEDNGVGLDDGARGGVGLDSMRQRALELGGSCDITPGASGGTLVAVRLPLDAGGGAR